MTIDLNQTSRTMYCGDLRAEDVDRDVVLKGWVHYRRDHGQLIFVDLRDREGRAQIVFDPDQLPAEQFEAAHKLRAEDVLAIRGRVRRRPEGTVNPNLKTGEVEVLVSQFEALARSEVLPFAIDEFTEASENHRLEYRFLDLRRPKMMQSIVGRARLMKIVREYLDANGFLEIETPILTRSTPEGARDFLVPSRVNPGSFYALPQSPQLFKQILMVSGFDRYYQIARCFRDEDLRANRQPEFTQIDIEMSFITPDDLYAVMEGMMKTVFTGMQGVDVPTPFRRMDYATAMLRYGSDKPDLRFGLEIADVTDVFRSGCEFKVFNTAIEKGGRARALRVPGGGERYSNTQLKPGGELPEYAARYGAKGLAWFRAEAGEGSDAPKLASNIDKFFAPECLQNLAKESQAEPGDLILIVVDQAHTAAVAMGQLRLKIGRDLDLIRKDALEFCWITDFPFVEWDPEEKRWTALHHPFTSPHPEDLDRIESDPASVRSLAYDLSLNGEEIGGGSIRIHRPDVQRRVFGVLGIGEAEAQAKFGFLLKALSYGAPPHGGIAFGFDRMMMILQGTDSIRDVIPFPKTQSGACLMTEAPSPVDPKQLRELGVQLTPRAEKRLQAEQTKTDATPPEKLVKPTGAK